MQAFVIYLHGSPLEWQIERHIRHSIGHDGPVFYGFLDQSGAERALRAVPHLFDLDEGDALGLYLSAVEIPSRSSTN